MSIHIHSFLLQKAAPANTASFAGVFWFSIICLLGGQPGCTLQCSITSPFQPVILMAILIPAPHRSGLQTHPGLQPASTGRPSSASQGAQEQAVCPEHLSPQTS